MAMLLERPVLPTQHDSELAEQASRYLSQTNHKDAELSVQVEGGGTLRLPRAVSELLYHLLTEMAQGNAVTLIPVHAEMTTQEAADYLNVSRPYLIGLLETGKIAFHKTGTHRRVKFSDLETFRKLAELESNRAMDALAAQAQELGMGY